MNGRRAPIEPWDTEAMLRARVWFEEHHGDGWQGRLDSLTRVPGRAEKALASVVGGAVCLLVLGWALARDGRRPGADMARK